MASSIRTFQDTGNPVLDSLVNLWSGQDPANKLGAIKELHELLLRLALKEPGGLKVKHGHAIADPEASSTSI